LPTPHAAARKQPDTLASPARQHSVDHALTRHERLDHPRPLQRRRGHVVDVSPVVAIQGALLVDRKAEPVDDASQQPVSDGDAIRTAQVDHAAARFRPFAGSERHDLHGVPFKADDFRGQSHLIRQADQADVTHASRHTGRQHAPGATQFPDDPETVASCDPTLECVDVQPEHRSILP
jgi:hypothetical protein